MKADEEVSGVGILERFSFLTTRLFSKATDMIYGFSKSVSPVYNEDILSLCLFNCKNTLKTRVNLNKAFLNVKRKSF